ncbi:hypothetical protein [Thermococcus paralvinellae]|uniref:Uncharacterized protein n=1 Tax=Thermococcus paralvinellae TaxID=582419 RepID=W0I827_9EURY|nr:hypothetical protein [Thermococcus paralvinellae]AHF80610.1 Hypothetical protein TES1_1228 [Thermococcus paralvinellae]
MSRLSYVGAAMPGLGLMLSSWGQKVLWERSAGTSGVTYTGFPAYAILIGYIIVFVGAIIWVADLKFNTPSDEFRRTLLVSFGIFFLVGFLAVVLV